MAVVGGFCRAWDGDGNRLFGSQPRPRYGGWGGSGYGWTAVPACSFMMGRAGFGPRKEVLWW